MRPAETETKPDPDNVFHLYPSAALRQLESTDHHVLTFYPRKTDGNILRPHRRDARYAFADAAIQEHDDTTTQSTPEQTFFLAYRAIRWELHQMDILAQKIAALRKLTARGVTFPQRYATPRYASLTASGLAKGLQDAHRLKQTMDAARAAQDYSGFETLRLRFRGPLEMAAAGVVSPTLTVRHRPVQALDDPATPVRWLAFNVDVDEDAAGYSVIFLWEKDATALRAYADALVALSPRQIECFLPQFFLASCENTCFSEKWWASRNQADRNLAAALAGHPDPYRAPPKYRLAHPLLDSTLVSVERR